MRRRQVLTTLLKVVLALECIVLLAPATLMLMMAAVVALGSLMHLSAEDDSSWLWPLQLLGILMVPSVFGAIAVAEVGRIAFAVLGDRALPWSRRTLLSAGSGGIAAVAGGVGLFVLGQDQTPLGAAIVTLELVAPVLFLCGQLWWLQIRLRRRAASF